MSYKTKEKCYELALSALLLTEQVSNVDTTTNSNTISALNQFWDLALESTLQDLDLDALSTPGSLQLIEALTTNPHWTYAYKYPTNCAFMRRIESAVLTDRKSTQISKRVGQHDGQKAIFTNEYQASIEYIPNDVPLSSLNAMAFIALSLKLAELAAALLVGKGAKKLREDIRGQYLMAKFDAQETDKLENFNFEADYIRSEYVEERLS